MNRNILHRSRPVCFLGCLLLCVFMAVLKPCPVYAAEVNNIGITEDEGVNENRTVINEPGTAEDAEDLRVLNDKVEQVKADISSFAVQASQQLEIVNGQMLIE